MTNYLGSQPIIGNFVKLDAITVVNGQAAYTMQNGGANFVDYSSVNQFMVSLNSVIQSPGSSFTVSSSTITFASNLVTGDVIDFIIVFGNSLSAGEPTDATVTTAKLSGALVTPSTLDVNGNELILDADADTSITADTDDEIHFKAGGNDLLKLTANGLHFPQSGDGIYLGVTSETAANLLDDYEEGTWTPSIDGTSIGAVGFYRKIGKICLVHFGNQTAAALALGDGSDYDISGLPFSMIASDWNYGSVPSASFADATASYYSQPLTGRQNNGGNIHIMNRSGVAVTSSDPVNVSMVYSTN